MFSQEHDLANVIGIMRNLAIYGLQNGVGFTADRDRAHDVLRLERLDC